MWIMPCMNMNIYINASHATVLRMSFGIHLSRCLSILRQRGACRRRRSSEIQPHDAFSPQLYWSHVSRVHQVFEVKCPKSDSEPEEEARLGYSCLFQPDIEPEDDHKRIDIDWVVRRAFGSPGGHENLDVNERTQTRVILP